ncbi:MAG TPA: CPBP family intramembrane glutamic endopeptidase [Thermoanaerobaculia bacterium]|nr:CPBP family intramembrane glutamic endopeptidase [Thermoanaerobaculia bacterium]
MSPQRLTRRDFAFVASCLALAAIAIAIVVRYFSTAFPEISIDFRFTRDSSRPVAEKFLAAQHVGVANQTKHAVRFDTDDTSRIFLERELGLERANRVAREEVHLWYWHHRWFTPLVEEEVSVDVAPTGEIIGFQHKIPETRAAPAPKQDAAVVASAFLARIGVREIALVDRSERRLPKRVQRILTYESTRIHPAGAPYRHTVTLDGDAVTGYTQTLKVPDAWLRSYRELRSKNSTAGAVDTVFYGATMIAALVIFILRLRRGNLSLKFLLGIGIAAIVLTLGVALNALPSQLAYYDTNESYESFLAQMLFFGGVLQAIGTAMMLIVICGAGEVLYRERLPQHLAMPRVFSRKALTSKRVFFSMLLGYALVPAFMAYQAVFYLVAKRFGAWSPAELPYDGALNTALPWVGVLFAGFFPALSEEFLSRAFSIPFLQRFLRSRWPAIIASAFIWGFAHSTYPNQPFWIRGVEVGLAGVAAGLIMDRFGLLPLLIWHYTIDAVYTATLLFASGNTYYVVSAALSSLIFAVPLVASITLYLRNQGFVPDDELTNAALPVEPLPDETPAEREHAPFPDPIRPTRMRVIACLAAVALAALALATRPESTRSAVDYRITKDRAKEIARTRVREKFDYVIATSIPGFRSWDPQSGREDGGSLGEPDDIAATYLLREGMPVRELTRVFTSELEAAMYTVRFFTPLQKTEILVEVNARDGRVVGYHKYQEEERAGAVLAQPQALAIARQAFASYGLDVRAFDVKEALTYQQPKRRDWLFHFEERTPLFKDAHRRVSVRVAGDEVTQFQKHVKIPEHIYREATQQTFLNFALGALKLIGMVALLGLVIAGIIVSTRAHGLPWKRAAKWTLLLAILPIGVLLADREGALFGYNTSIAWDTFRIRQITSFITSLGLRLGLLFLALAGLNAAIPFALDLGSREARARFGRSAVLAALTTLAIVLLALVANQHLAHVVRSSAEIQISAPSEVAIPLPAFSEIAQAILGAIVASAAIALYANALRTRAAIVTMTGVALAMLDPSVTLAQTPLMVLRAIAVAVLVWLVARYVLNGNPLAWPLTIFLTLTTSAAAALLRNHRSDLLMNGVAVLVIAAAVIVWSVGAKERVDA